MANEEETKADREIFAKNLKHYMEINNISRYDLCKALDFNYNTLTDWVNARKLPRMGKVQKMADYFGVLKSDLIEDKPYSPQANEDVTADKVKRWFLYTATAEERDEIISVYASALSEGERLQLLHKLTCIK